MTLQRSGCWCMMGAGVLGGEAARGGGGNDGESGLNGRLNWNPKAAAGHLSDMWCLTSSGKFKKEFVMTQLLRDVCACVFSAVLRVAWNAFLGQLRNLGICVGSTGAVYSRYPIYQLLSWQKWFIRITRPISLNSKHVLVEITNLEQFVLLLGGLKHLKMDQKHH